MRNIKPRMTRIGTPKLLWFAGFAVLVTLVQQGCAGAEGPTDPPPAGPPVVPTPSKLAVVGAPSSSAASRALLATQPVVQLQDANGNAVARAGTAVTVAITTGGGTLAGTATVNTSASGAATFTDLAIAGRVGGRTLTFSAPSLTSATASVTLTPGVATSMVANGAIAVSGTVGSAASSLPSVRVTDADSNNVSGVAVTFAVASGGGSITGATQATDTAGVATVGGWTLGTATGSNTLSATAASLTAVTFSASAAAGAPAVMVLTAAPSAIAQNRIVFPSQPSFQLRDAFGNAAPQAGVAITTSIAAGGDSLAGTTTAATNAAGVATFSDLSIRGLVGARTMRFTAPGLPNVTAPVTVRAGLPTTLTMNAGNNVVADASAIVASPPSVKVTDANGNAVSGVAVTFSVATGGGSVSGASQTTDTLGVATVGGWQLGALPGANSVTATATPIAGSLVTFNATANPVFRANVSSADSTAVSGPAARVALPTGTSAAVVSTQAGGAAKLVITEVGGANPSSGSDSSRFLVAQVTGGATDSTVLRLSVLVSDAPAPGEKQWLFARSQSDPPGVGSWYEATVAQPALMATPSDAARFGLSSLVAGSVTLTFQIALSTNTPTNLYLLRPQLTDPAGCTNSRQFEPYPGRASVANPSVSVVLIHGWQPFMKCKGVNVPNFTDLDDYHPESDWTAMAAKLHERFPTANVYFVRYSTTASPSAAGAYVREKLATLNGGNTGPIVLVGHSSGGLVARYAASGDPLTRKVSEIITLGTPHLGTSIADVASAAALLTARFFPSQGFGFLGTNVVNNDIPLPAPVPTHAVRGGVPCIPGQGPNTSWLQAPWSVLCLGSIDSDGLVPAASAVPPSLAADSYVPPLPSRGVDHRELRANSDVIEKVASWIDRLPRFALSTANLSFTAVTTGANPASQDIAITNAGTGTLSDLSVDAITYATGQPTGWLSAAFGAPAAPTPLTVTASVAGLAPGTYNATIALKSAAAGVTNSPQSVTVTFVVTATAPTITLSAPSLLFNAVATGSSPAPQNIAITNTGTGVLSDLTVDAISYGPGATGWLTASLGGSTAPVALTAGASVTDLAAGTYTATVSIKSTVSGVTNSPQPLNVTFTVAAAAPTITLSASAATYNATAGGLNPLAQSASVTNTGTGLLSGLSVGTIAYGLGQPTGWLGASLDNSTAPATLTFSATTGSLPAGSYTATLPVQSSVAGVTNSPQSISVTFLVAAVPAEVADTLFRFDRIPGAVTRSGSLLFFASATFSINRDVTGVSVNGSSVERRDIVGPFGGIAAITYHGDNAYWIGTTAGDIVFDKLRTSPTVNGGPGTVVTIASSVGDPSYRSDCLVATDTHVYFVGQTSPGIYALRKLALADNSVTDLVAVTSGAACAMDAGTIFYEDRAGNAIKSIPIGGGTPALLASGVSFADGPSVLRVTGSLIVLSDGTTIRSLPKSGGSVTTRAGDLLGLAPSAVVVGSVLYVHENDSSPRCTSFSLIDWSRSLRTTAGCEAADDTSVYWFDRSAPDVNGDRLWVLLKAPR